MLGEDFSVLRASLVGILLAALVLMLKQLFAVPGLPSSEFLLLLPLWFAATVSLFVIAFLRKLAAHWLLAREERRRAIRIAPRTDNAHPAR